MHAIGYMQHRYHALIRQHILLNNNYGGHLSRHLSLLLGRGVIIETHTLNLTFKHKTVFMQQWIALLLRKHLFYYDYSSHLA